MPASTSLRPVCSRTRAAKTRGLTLGGFAWSPLFFEPCDRTRRCRAYLSLAMQSLRELGNSRFLCLKAIPYGFRPFLVDRDRKELIAVIERIEARIRIARDAIVRRRGIIGRRRFLNLLRMWQFMRERQRFPQQGFNPLTRLSGIIRHPLRYAELFREKQVQVFLRGLASGLLSCALEPRAASLLSASSGTCRRPPLPKHYFP
jgi:hypothetical protein